MARSSARDIMRVAVLLVSTIVHSVFGAPSCALMPPKRPPASLADQIIMCREEDRKCFDFNKIYFEGKCYAVGSPGPCRKYEILVVDKSSFEEGNIVQGACRNLYPCDKNVFQERMAHDQCCYEVDDIQRHICLKENNLHLRKNIFGEGECELILQNSSEVHVPKVGLRKGFCYFPNISFSYDYKNYFYESHFKNLKVDHALLNMTIQCSEEEIRCFSKNKVLFRGDKKCYSLLTRGPCMQGSWITIDEGALEAENRLVPVCSGHRCLPGHVFMAREQRCRSLEDLQMHLCASEDLLFDLFGQAHCGRFTTQKSLLAMPQHLEGDTCVLKDHHEEQQLAGEVVGSPFCAPDDHNKCQTPLNFPPPNPQDSR